ncbi:MAG: hypothetical protein E7559_09530 [Ruminococcaceae bacterium]|nr:hypothetical protein [Oscillospiraceae bacterium]
MSNVTATGTVWNLPCYAGQLYTSTPTETPFLNLIAHKAVKTDNFQFPTGAEYSHEQAAQPAITEAGSLTAPTAISYVRSQSDNVTQIFQERVSVSYARLSGSGRLSGITGMLAGAEVPGELEFQTARALEKIARDIEYTFINGTYQLASAADVANKTRGIINACATSVDAEGAVLTRAMVNGALAAAYAAGATFTDTVLLCGAAVKQAITDAYASQWGFSAPPSREMAGANIMQIETDFGRMSVLLSRFVPAGTLIGADISCIRPVEQDVPGKGCFFREPLSKTGAAEEYQIFGQIGLDHGPMWKHFVISGIGAAEA